MESSNSSGLIEFSAKTAKTISNTNELLGNFEGIYGIKTGFTNGANRCLVTACKRGDLDVICVVLGCDTKKEDAEALVARISESYPSVDVDLYDGGQPLYYYLFAID